MGLLTAGLIALPGVEFRQLAAQEKATETATSESTAAADAKPAQSNAADSAPVINLDETNVPKTKPADDIEIETLPDGTPRIPPGRPQWINKDKPVSLNGPVHTIYVTPGPYKRETDARQALDNALKQTLDEYIADQLRSPLAPTLIRSYDVRTIHDRFVKSSNIYHETVTFGDPIGRMEQFHALLELDSPFREELKAKWDKVTATSRLFQVGLFAGGALLLLSSVFGYFRLDNATRGYYTGRLQFMTAAAILAIIAGVVASAFGFTWL